MTVKLTDPAGSSLIFDVVPENNSWRIRVEHCVPGEDHKLMMLDGWYPSRFAAEQELPLWANTAMKDGWTREDKEN